MADKIYQMLGTPVSFASAGDVIWTPVSPAAGAGWKSALWDRGVLPQSQEYEWRAKVQWATACPLGSTFDFYMATSDGTIIDGLVTAGDATFLDTDALPNLHYIGSVVNDLITPASVQGSGVFSMTARYGILVGWNNAATIAGSATAADYEFIATPSYPQSVTV